jgi:hypothetical protein
LVHGTPVPPFVGGMAFTVEVTYSNTGDTAENNVNSTFNFGTYTGCSVLPGTTAVNIAADASGITQDFTISIAASAASNASVWIQATYAGSEAISGRALSGNSVGNNLHVAIQAQANIAITGITLAQGNGTYVGGQTFTVSTEVKNTAASGAASAINVVVTLAFGRYGSLSASPSTGITIPAGDNQDIDIVVTVSNSAMTNSSVLVSATVAASEEISGRVLSAGPVTIGVSIQSRAFVIIPVVMLNATITRPNRWVLATVTFKNTGGTAVNSSGITLIFNNTYIQAQVAVNLSTGLYLPANGRDGVQIRFFISPSAPNNTWIDVDARFSGTEAISGRNVTIVGANTSATLSLEVAGLIVTMSNPAGRFTFVQGESFALVCTLDNSQGTLITNGTLALEFGGATGISANTTYLGIDLSVGSSVNYSFVVTTTVSTPASVSVNAHFVGPPDQFSNKFTFTIQSISNLSITSVSFTIGNGTYIAGQQFVVRIDFINSGGTAVDEITVMLTFNESSALSTNASATITLQASGTGTVDFLVTVSNSSLTSRILIGALFSGTEAISGRTVNGTQGLLSATVSILASALVRIENIQSMTGNANYAPGDSFILRVTFNNTGGIPAYNVNVSITDGTYTGLFIAPAGAVTVPSDGSAFQDINITILSNAASGVVIFALNWTGIEAITGRPLSGGSVPGTFTINIEAPGMHGFSQTTIILIGVIVAALVGLVAVVAIVAKKKKMVHTIGKKSQPYKKRLPEYQTPPAQAVEVAVEPYSQVNESSFGATPEGVGEGATDVVEDVREGPSVETIEPLDDTGANSPNTRTADEIIGNEPDTEIYKKDLKDSN